MKKLGIAPQHCLYSATFNEDVIGYAGQFVGDYMAFPIKKEALKLKGVRMNRIHMQPEDKLDFVCKSHTDLDRAMCMVFVNHKETARVL